MQLTNLIVRHACFALLGMLGLLAALAEPARAQPASKPAGAKPNILFVTVDDMSCDSIGAFGCKLADTSPNVDRLAGEGLRFKYAHVQTAACMPSRNAMLSGRYPHNNGVEGFYQVRTINYPVMADLMRSGG